MDLIFSPASCIIASISLQTRLSLEGEGIQCEMGAPEAERITVSC